MKIDINSCRVCLENVGVIPFFQEHGDEIVSKMISSLFNINVIYDENLPTNICTNCLENIKLCILTKNIIVNSESMLKTYLKRNLTEETAENLNQIKVEPEDPVTTPELIELEAEEIKIERSEDSSQDFEDEQCGGLQIAHVQSLTSLNPQIERMDEKIHSDISNIPSVQDVIDSRKKPMEKLPNLTVTLHPSASTSTSQLQGASSNRAFGNTHLQDTTSIFTIDGDRNIEMPKIKCRLDKMENDIGTVIVAVSNIDKKINKLIEAVANIGTLMSKKNYQGSSQPIEPIGNTSSFSSLLPINDQQVFGEFETMLRNKDNYHKFVTEMATYGGTSGDKKGDRIAYGLVDQLFTRQFMTECSWTGSSKNQALKNTFSSATTFLDAFYDIIKLADDRYSKSEAKEFFKEKILRNAKSRLLNLQQKGEPIKKRRRMVKAPVKVNDVTANAVQTTVTETSDLTTVPNP